MISGLRINKNRVATDCSRKRILYIVNVDWFFISHRLPLAIEAARMGLEVHIATRVTNRRAHLEMHGFKVHALEINRSSVGIISLIADFFRMLRIIWVVRPDLLHLITIKPMLLGGIAARLLNVPSLIIAVSGLGYVFGNSVRSRIIRTLLVPIYRFVFQHNNVTVIFQNQSDKVILGQITGLQDSAGVLINGSGVDLIKYKYSDFKDGPAVVIFAARLLIDKGVVDFVEAAKMLRTGKYMPNCPVRCLIVGEPDPDNPNSISKEELNKWSEEGFVELLGHRADMHQVISDAHIVVLPSYYMEGIPKILIEAAACGRPTITTDHPGCRDAIIPGVTGLIVPIKQPSQIAAAIKAILEEPGSLERMGKAGRKLAEDKYNIIDIANKHGVIYNKTTKS